MTRTLLRGFPVLVLWAAASTAVAAEPLGFDGARHLLNRTSFAANVDDVAAFARLTREQAAHRLLAWTAKPRVTPPPAWAGEPYESPHRIRTLSDEERMRFRREQVRKGIELRGWWLQEMLTTPSPLSEKMTLFWHNHFVSSQQKVRSPQLMYRQNLLLRRHALGNFGAFLHAIARDPAMVIYLRLLDGNGNLPFAVDFRDLYATVLERWWGVPSAPVLNARFTPVDLLRS
ncbi:MAG: DUF1800 family protein [Betaproteobacteria bacterium]|nr:DUF1800 family protein [Betaproteobacteria bacterium]